MQLEFNKTGALNKVISLKEKMFMSWIELSIIGELPVKGDYNDRFTGNPVPTLSDSLCLPLSNDFSFYH